MIVRREAVENVAHHQAAVMLLTRRSEPKFPFPPHPSDTTATPPPLLQGRSTIHYLLVMRNGGGGGGQTITSLRKEERRNSRVLSLMSFCSRLLEASACESPWVGAGLFCSLTFSWRLQVKQSRVGASKDDFTVLTIICLQACRQTPQKLGKFSLLLTFVFRRCSLRHAVLEMGPL